MMLKCCFLTTINMDCYNSYIKFFLVFSLQISISILDSWPLIVIMNQPMEKQFMNKAKM